MASSPSDAPTSGPLVFVADDSSETAILTGALRGRGYSVVEVPLTLLAGRVATQRPALILCDVDADGALETVNRLRDVPGGAGVDIVFLGEAGKTLDDMADAVFHEGSGFFVRPVDVYAVVRKVEGLIGSPPSPPVRSEAAPRLGRSSRPPPTRQSATPPHSGHAQAQTSPGRERPSAPFDEDIDDLGPPSLPPAVPLDAELGVGSQGGSAGASMSSELELLLSRAEARIDGSRSSPPSHRPTPEQEIESVLPADVLAALDEPLDEDDEDDDPDDEGRQTGSRQTTGGGTGVKTGHGVRAHDPATGIGTGVSTGAGTGTNLGSAALSTADGPETPLKVPADAPARGVASLVPMAPSTLVRPNEGSVFDAVTNPGRAAPPVSSPPATEVQPGLPVESRAQAPPPAPPPERDRIKAPSPVPLDVPSTLAPGDAVVALARAIRARFSGALAFEGGGGIRRVVFRDGDFATASSGIEGESLVAFLAKRGDVDPEVATSLGRRIAQFGRHAGAALVAHGHLKQDQLWPVLRSHAEWILASAAALEAGAIGVETTIPGRLEEEPAVFGGATGAEVLIETVRRVVAPSVAIRRLGGANAVFERGPAWTLLAECALADDEAGAVQRGERSQVGDLAQAVKSADFASVLYALRELGVIARADVRYDEAVAAPIERSADDGVIDDEATRARIAARMALVRDGDYFALLGVGRDATGYDVRRAYTELRREFEPSRIMSARTAHLLEDVETILEVLDEAYAILRSDVRRDRYKRAIEASP